MAKPNWMVKAYAAASRAAKHASVEQFRQQRRGLVMSRWRMWANENPIPLARWNNDVLLVVLDGAKRNRGKLMLVRGELAYEVVTKPDVLRAIYVPHQESRWWVEQTLHRCEPLPEAS